MNELSYYPSGRANIVSHPQDLPRFASESNVSLQMLDGDFHYSGTSNFWTWFARNGTVTTLSEADTWTPIINITGKGFLGNVVAPHANSVASKTIGIRLEWDNQLWDWEQTFSPQHEFATLVLGALSPGDGRWSSYSRQMTTADATPGWVPGAYAPLVMPATALMSNGAAVLEFKASLKVSVKSSIISAVNAGDKAGCTWVRR